MVKESNRSLLAQAALLLCGVLWGSGFVVMKNSLDALTVNWLLAIRFLMAAIALCGLLYKRLARANRVTLIGGAVCGTLMYFAYFIQTLGLTYTTAGNNAFLTAFYVVLVPFFHWAVSGGRPTARNVAAACLCLTGVGFIALTPGFSVNIGDVLTLLCGVIYALHIVCVSYYTEHGADVMALTALQFSATALIALPAALLFEPLPAPAALAAPDVLFPLLYLGLGCTLLALVLQNIGIRYAPPAHASLLMSTEAPFGSLFGVLFLNEAFTARFALGATLIVGAIALSQMGVRGEAADAPAATAAAAMNNVE